MMPDTPEKPDTRFLIVVLIFGIVATCASVNWFNRGEIAIRNTTRNSMPVSKGRASGVIPSSHVLFYPITTAWGLLGATMATLSIVGYLKDDEHLIKLCGYSCLAILLLAFCTVGLAMWLGP